jgi:hypothetical protein
MRKKVVRYGRGRSRNVSSKVLKITQLIRFYFHVRRMMERWKVEGEKSLLQKCWFQPKMSLRTECLYFSINI